jgi:hypothetical protein
MGSGCKDHIFLTSALVGGEWSTSRPGRFTPGERAPGGWVDLRGGLDDLEKRKLFTLPGFELRPLCRPAGSYSLYRLSYPGSSLVEYTHIYMHSWPKPQNSAWTRLIIESKMLNKILRVL